jgi:hypothetical protein
MRKRVMIAMFVMAVSAMLLDAVQSESRNSVLQKAGLTPEARAAILTVGDDVRKLEKSHEGFAKAARDLDGLYVKLLQKAREVSRLAAEAEKAKSAQLEKLFQAAREMAEMSQSFNVQYLDLQKQMQDENRRFTLVSNIMKTKHDTAKNAINNVR